MNQLPAGDLALLPNDRNPVLLTKLHLPHHPVHFVSRDRLSEKLTRALQCKLSLVIAPPGFGKTTAVCHWLRDKQIRAGWVSLDKGENDLLRFWSYVIAALDRIRQGTGKKALTLLQSPVVFSIDLLVAWLVNDLVDLPYDLVLILDDYHLIESEEVHRSFFYFLERLPGQIHIVLVSRKEPAFPVATFRAKGQLNPIGVEDLKFTKEETDFFWRELTGAPPDESTLHLLAHRTEGWAAGIQLAVLARSAGHREPLKYFSGDHRFVADYMVEEVFLNQPESVRTFLMRSSVLERMNRDLCAEVTSETAEEDMLARIEQAGLFLIPLDGKRYWYRYHHLFADFLHSRLHQDCAGEASGLHLRASEWFERNGYMDEAIDHAFSAEDYEKAARLLQKAAAVMLRRRELTTLGRWLGQLPDSVLMRPNIIVIRVWTELLQGRYSRVKKDLEVLKAAIGKLYDEDEALFNTMCEEAVIIEIFYMMLNREYDSAIDSMEQLYLRDNLPDGAGLLLSVGIELNEGTVPFIRGYYGFEGRMRLAERFHRVYDAFIHKNKLYHFAFAAYQRAAMCEIGYERNDLHEALQHAETAIEMGKRLGIMGAYTPAVIVKSRVQRLNDDPEAAMQTVIEARDHLLDNGHADTQWLGLLNAYIIRFRLLKGETGPVSDWMKVCKLSLDTDVTINLDYEWITFVRVLIAKDRFSEALVWTERLLAAARQNGRIMTELEACIYLAVIKEKMNLMYDGMLHLHQALQLGEREGYLRMFADTPELTPLLRLYAEARRMGYMPELQTGVTRPYFKKVMSVAYPLEEKDAREREEAAPAHTLTSRETEVLRLIAEGLTNKEIAERLVLTEGTVKLHLNRIYGKLQVKGRVQAIQKGKLHRIIE